ncbi:MAG TPA: hypothetical protein VL424_17820, partial [Pararobbsia sp.]|nr:hypothetical protein [Pararobbsia sp.]
DNPLRDLPAELAALDRLEWINLERCEFRSIPPVLEQMNPRTAVRIVDGNPLSEAIAPSRLAQAEPSLQARRTAAVPAEAPAPVDPPGASDDCRTSVLRIFD